MGLPVQAAGYTVQPGDSLWKISHQSGVSVDRLAKDNHLADANLIYAGQELVVAAPPAPNPVPSAPSLNPIQARAILVAAARNHGLRQSFAMAVAWWESGWNQEVVSRDGAVGLMQILPATEAWAAPALLGHHVDLRDPTGNADLGCALLRTYLEEFDDPKLALAAYYQGAASARKYGVLPSSRGYVDGIWALRNRFEASAQ